METVTTGRAKRATAGNRMRDLLMKAQQEDEDDLFKEVEDDEEFAAPQDVKDVFLDEFADTDDEVEMDEEETERQMLKEERRKAKGKSKAIYNPLAPTRPKTSSNPTSKPILSSRPSTSTSHIPPTPGARPSTSSLPPGLLASGIDPSTMAPSTLALALRKERREAKRAGRNEARRSTMRASTLKSQLDLDEKERLEALKSGGGDEGEREAGEKKRKGRKAQHEGGEIRGIRPLTQDELIAAALEEEEKNKEALRDWLKKEEEKRELRRVGRKRVRGPRWTWVSRTVGGRLVEEVQAQVQVAQPGSETVETSGKAEQKEGDAVSTGAAEVGNTDESGEAAYTGIATDRPLEPTKSRTEPSFVPVETATPAAATQFNVNAQAEAAETEPAISASASTNPAIPLEADRDGQTIPATSQIPLNGAENEVVDSIPAPANPPELVSPSQNSENDTKSASTTAIASTSDTLAPTPSLLHTVTGPSGNATSSKPIVPVTVTAATAAAADSTISTPPNSSQGPAAAIQPVIPPTTTQPAIPTPSATPAPEPTPTLPTEATPAPSGPYTRNYIILSQVPGGLAGEMKLVLGDHVEWDKVKYIPGRARPLKLKPPMCAITGLPAKYRHPRLLVPYATAQAYKTLEAITQEQYFWSSDLGAWMGEEEGEHAAGVYAVKGWEEAVGGGWKGGRRLGEEGENGDGDGVGDGDEPGNGADEGMIDETEGQEGEVREEDVAVEVKDEGVARDVIGKKKGSQGKGKRKRESMPAAASSKASGKSKKGRKSLK